MNQLDYEYFEWLVGEIAVPARKTYNDLFDRMHNLEFVWFIPNDDNRIQDGMDVRNEFLNGSRGKLTQVLGGVSLLEVLVALSRRVAFNAGGKPERWAWELVKNLKLHKASDPLIGAKGNKVEEALESLVWRTYNPDGTGGFFPLTNPKEDQTKVEIWYQMNAYVNEMRNL